MDYMIGVDLGTFCFHLEQLPPILRGAEAPKASP